MSDCDANSSELLILRILRDQGLTAEKIPESNEGRTPDILAEDSTGLRYAIEVKEKLPSEDEVALRRAAFDAGKVFVKTESQGSRNRLSGLVNDAVDQLTSPLAPLVDLRLVCLVSVVRDGEFRTARLRSTLWGEQWLIDVEAETTHRCFYFGDSSFYKHGAMLDGALTLDPEGMSLIVNAPHSPNADVLSQSVLAQVLAGAVHDPTEIEERGLAFLADTTLPRGKQNEGAVLSYLQTKYGVTKLIAVPRSTRVGEVVMRAPSAAPPVCGESE